MNSIIDLHSYGHDIETAWLVDRGLEGLGDAVLIKFPVPFRTFPRINKLLHNILEYILACLKIFGMFFHFLPAVIKTDNRDGCDCRKDLQSAKTPTGSFF